MRRDSDEDSNSQTRWTAAMHQVGGGVFDKVRLHADLCVLATLAQALSRAHAVPLAA